MIEINVTGIETLGPPEDRNLLHLLVKYNDILYDWKMYIPQETDINDYVEKNKLKIQNDIAAKEAEWEALDPKTKTIQDPMTGIDTVYPIEKHEIVCPEIPDYYAKRRAEYPKITDQIGALMAGEAASPSIDEIKAEILAVKKRYPKS